MKKLLLFVMLLVPMAAFANPETSGVCSRIEGGDPIISKVCKWYFWGEGLLGDRVVFVKKDGSFCRLDVSGETNPNSQPNYGISTAHLSAANGEKHFVNLILFESGYEQFDFWGLIFANSKKATAFVDSDLTPYRSAELCKSLAEVNLSPEQNLSAGW